MVDESSRPLVPLGPPTWPELAAGTICGFGGVAGVAATGGRLVELGWITLGFALGLAVLAWGADHASATEPAYGPQDRSLVEVAGVAVPVGFLYPVAADAVSFLPQVAATTAYTFGAGAMLAFAFAVAVKTFRTVRISATA